MTRRPRITPAEARRRTAVRVEAAVLAYLRARPAGATVGRIVDDTGESVTAVLTVLKRLERSAEVEYVGEST